MRIKRLDILRCFAVLLVVLYHGELPWRIASAGYVGVDLFFVLSGFLISGLLFAEYKKRGSINFARFFIRRSLKIYPSFYLLILVTFIYQVRFHQWAPLSRYLYAILYVQNYTSRLWGYEWSLAVEEHFYILLPLFLFLLIRWSSRRANPFRAIPWAFLFVAVACLAFRIGAVSRLSTTEFQVWTKYTSIYVATHHRMDALFFGVFLGYLQHFQPDFLDRLLNRKSVVFFSVLVSAMLLAPAVLLPQRNKLMITAGVTSLYLGFGIILILSLHVREIVPRIIAQPCAILGNVCASIGMYSYSIYLWHGPVRSWGFTFIQKILHFRLALLPGFVIYLSASLLVGILFSRLVEYPILKVRDRILPAIQSESAPVSPSQKDSPLASCSPTHSDTACG
jgi:peptidoglycan/LPS O-acetylase OafA/YrhL